MKNRVIVNIKGKNIDGFINRLIKNKIQLYKIKHINHNEINITINFQDYKTIKQNKTIYEIRLELRKINIKNEDKRIYNIVAKKEAIIKKIEASSGEKIKNINDYVKKGDIIINSNITLNENIT